MKLLNIVKRIVGLRNYETITEPFRSPKGWLTFKYVQLFPNVIIKKSLHKPKASNTIVSLTTFGQRKNQVHWTILSILNGTLLPENINLYVTADLVSYFSNHHQLTYKLVKSGFLIIHPVEEDLGPYTKLFYALSDYPHKNIVIADDDVLYHKYWLKILSDLHKMDPNSVWAHRVHGVKYNSDGTIKPYLQWDWECTKSENISSDLFPTGVGGILFPPKVFPDLVFNKELFRALCPTADDVWWWFCLNLNHITIKGVQTDGKPLNHTYYEFNRNNIGLNEINVSQGANDKQINALFEWQKQHRINY